MKSEVKALMWYWSLKFNLKFGNEIEVWSWSLKLKIEVEVWSLKFEVWSLKLKLEVYSRSLKLKFEVEVKVWSWSLRLDSKIKTGVWALNLKHAVKDWSLNFRVLFFRNQLNKWQCH